MPWPCAVALTTGGVRKQVSLFGANVVSFTRPDGEQVLHLNKQENDWDGMTPIRSGFRHSLQCGQTWLYKAHV